jgi:hypothetical protein
MRRGGNNQASGGMSFTVFASRLIANLLDQIDLERSSRQSRPSIGLIISNAAEANLVRLCLRLQPVKSTVLGLVGMQAFSGDLGAGNS